MTERKGNALGIDVVFDNLEKRRRVGKSEQSTYLVGDDASHGLVISSCDLMLNK